MSSRPFACSILLLTLPVVASCGGSSSGTGPSGTDTTTTTAAGLDGSWDILAAGNVSLAASSMTVSAGAITGLVVLEREGTVDHGCTLAKDRAEFRLNFAGNAASGSITTITEYEGSDCRENKRKVTAISGSRTSTSAGTGLTGSWEMQVGDADPFAVDVDGLVAKAWERKKDKADGDEPDMSASVAGNSLTVTSDHDRYTFSARRR